MLIVEELKFVFTYLLLAGLFSVTVLFLSARHTRISLETLIHALVVISQLGLQWWLLVKYLS